MTTPALTVIVPAYRCADMLRASLEGLQRSDLPREAWELVVVDDGSPDDTGDVARRIADVVVRIDDGPRGPAHARNAGAVRARGEVLLFVDADVVVAPHTLRGMAEQFAADPALTVLFGAYDAAPADPGRVSQYRNLLHRYVHLQGAGGAQTFWAGCGAIRRSAFLAAGGFDAGRYPRPQIEDIELGYRLHDRGGRLRLDPALTGTHLKRWTLGGMLHTDLRDRAIPWMHLLLARRETVRAGPLNLAVGEKLLTALAGVGVAGLGLALLLRDARWGWLPVVAVCMIVLGNLPLFAWFARHRGVGFALLTVPLRVLFYVVSAIGGAWAVLTHAWQQTPAALPPLAAPGVRHRAPVSCSSSSPG